MTLPVSVFEPVRALIQGADRFVICSHESPEGDCLGASLGLFHALCALGKTVHLYNPDPVPRAYRFLPGAEHFSSSLPEEPCGAVFVLDCGDLARIGAAHSVVRRLGPVVNLDHHASNTRFGDFNFVYPGMSSTGELIYHLLRNLDLPVRPPIAISLYAAIVTDTGSFRYSNASAETFLVAKELIECGARPAEVAEGLYESHSIARLHLLKRVLETLTLLENGRLATLELSRRMLEETGACQADAEGFINYARGLEGVEVAAFFREREGDVVVSLRSKGRVDVAGIAAAFRGGGHRAAAGCTIEGTLASVAAMVAAQVRLALEQSPLSS